MPLLSRDERRYISRYSQETIGLAIYVEDALHAADDVVLVSLYREPEPYVRDTTDLYLDGGPGIPGGQHDVEPGAVLVLNRQAIASSVGMYQVSLNSSDTAEVGNYTVRWNYSVMGQQEIYETYIEIGGYAPDYDRLAQGLKDVVEQVWLRFEDLFDSPDGGAHLATYFQEHYTRNRVAQLLKIAVGLLNTTAQPYQTYSVDNFPIAAWGALLDEALYVEVLKHFVRSYVEQPQVILGGSVSRMDRRDYMDRWRLILADERMTLKQQLATFKIANMGLGKARVMVSGGAYGRYGPTRLAGNAAAQPRYWSRFY